MYRLPIINDVVYKPFKPNQLGYIVDIKVPAGPIPNFPLDWKDRNNAPKAHSYLWDTIIEIKWPNTKNPRPNTTSRAIHIMLYEELIQDHLNKYNNHVNKLAKFKKDHGI